MNNEGLLRRRANAANRRGVERVGDERRLRDGTANHGAYARRSAPDIAPERRDREPPGTYFRTVCCWTIGNRASAPRAEWLIMPRMPSMAARPLLRSAFSLKALTSGSSYRTQSMGKSWTTPC